VAARETPNLLIFVGLCKFANELLNDVVKSIIRCSKAIDSKKLLNNNEESRGPLGINTMALISCKIL
jgi:hypothetical protein